MNVNDNDKRNENMNYTNNDMKNKQKMKKNEAVVPLPDNRSIPVDLKGGGSNISNITVNVSGPEGKQQVTANAGEQQRKLGVLVASVVQAEMLKQQAPGGLLSPYGDGGG